jgi:hypothetical protein
MFAYPLRAAALTVAAAIGLSACTTPYGYSGVSVGYGNSGYYDPYYGYGYGYPRYGYSRLGYGYSPYWGWNDGFYYPGSGFYVYDAYRRPFRWTTAQRRYWELRRQRAIATSTTTRPVVIRDNWDDFKRSRSIIRNDRVERSVSRPVRIERNSRPTKAERRVERSEAKSSRRQERRSTFSSSTNREESGSRSNGRRNGQTREQ